MNNQFVEVKIDDDRCVFINLDKIAVIDVDQKRNQLVLLCQEQLHRLAVDDVRPLLAKLGAQDSEEAIVVRLACNLLDAIASIDRTQPLANFSSSAADQANWELIKRCAEKLNNAIAQTLPSTAVAKKAEDIAA